jgi:hypothetical protein
MDELWHRGGLFCQTDCLPSERDISGGFIYRFTQLINIEVLRKTPYIVAIKAVAIIFEERFILTLRNNLVRYTVVG